MGRRTNRRIVLACFPLVAAGCSGDRPGAGLEPPTAISEAAAAYLAGVVGVMREHSVVRETIDWTAFESEVFDSAGPAQSFTQTYPAIKTALRLLGDNHSYFSGANGVGYQAGVPCPYRGATGPETVPPAIGYIRVNQDVDAQLYQNTIHSRDSDAIVGWIVDIRSNRGGNMYPMVAGLGPILGEGTAGFFLFPGSTQHEIEWRYEAGKVLYDGYVFAQVDSEYVLINPNPRVAVLINDETASSAEGVAISFRSRPDTRFFGTTTCGQSTGVEPFRMSDGALLGLATAWMADRRGTTYPAGVIPDEVIPERVDPLARAMEWLLSDGPG